MGIFADPANRTVGCRVKHLSKFVTSGSRGWAEYYSDEGPVFIRMGNLSRTSIDLRLDDIQRVSPPQGAEGERTRAESNDILVSVTAYVGTIGIVPSGLGEAYVNQHTALLRPNRRVVPRWLAYVLTADSSQHMFRQLMYGGTKQGIGLDDLKNIPIELPPLSEQRAIAAFLDRKTAQIDDVVAKKRRLIQRLQEKRQALISHAVTKGLDPHAPMKDSGIEWLGEVPAHWNFCKLGYVANIVRGASPRPAGDPHYFNGDAAPWITVAEVTKDSCKYLTSTSTCLTAEGQALSRLLRSGTLILTNSGATLGVPKITQIDGCINDGSVAFLEIRRSVSKDYLYYFLSSLTQMLRERASGQGQPNLNTDIVKAIPFPFGPLEVQDRIVAFIEGESNRISNVIDALQKQIAKLQEYRQTLISAAVTGKIDVAKEAAHD